MVMWTPSSASHGSPGFVLNGVSTAFKQRFMRTA
jgi:hypothetical protein